MSDDASQDHYGIDLYNEVLRLRALNSKLTTGVFMAGIAAVVGVAVGVGGLIMRPAPERLAVDPAGRVFPVAMLSKNDPPDSRVTRMAGDCVNDLLNHAFHNYQTTVERAVSGCFTGGGTESVRATIDPLLKKMKDEQLNIASNYVIQPFINSRKTELGRRVYKVQGIIAVGYRGRGASSQPLKYAFETDVVRVPYESHIEGIRLQNIVLKMIS